jgi:hypothetical protein
MLRKLALLVTLSVCLLVAGGWFGYTSKPTTAKQPETATPVDGYTVHVTAPHLVNGHVMGPYHHYCKVIAPDPYIVCQIYDNTDPNAPMTQIEFIIAKKLTRPAIDRESWNRLWHDHAVEIAGGRVKVLDLPPDKAKEVADLVATTDGIIYNIEYDGKLPNGKVSMAQAVGHKPLTAAEFAQSRKEMAAAPGAR